ncbi:MAG TPA: PH domain-containing protein [Streptosporangiaceae bacterium]
MSSSPERHEAWRRLHPLSPLVRSGRGVVAVLALTGLSTSGAVVPRGGPRWWDLIVAVGVAAGAVVNWLVTRWKLDGVTLRIETGVLRRDSRQLPVARIQAVDVVRPFLARMLGLAELSVRLAGSSHADGRLAYLTEQSAISLRARLLAAHYGLDPATPEPAEQVMAVVPAGRLVGSVLVPALCLGTALVAAGLLLAAVYPSWLVAAAGATTWWVVISVTMLWRKVSEQYGFTVAASPDGIRIRRGLLGTVAETIPVLRVQAVRMIEPLLWRPFGWRRLEVDVAGHPGREPSQGTGAIRKALLPVGHRDEAWRLVQTAVGAGMPELTRPPRRARWKAPLRYHFLAAGHNDALAVTVTGRVRKITTWVPLAKTQSVRLVQGPLQRGLGLATVHLDAAGRHVRAEFAERAEDEAERLVDELAAGSRSARRHASLIAQLPPAGLLRGFAVTAGNDSDGQAASVASPVNAAQSDE